MTIEGPGTPQYRRRHGVQAGARHRGKGSCSPESQELSWDPHLVASQPGGWPPPGRVPGHRLGQTVGLRQGSQHSQPCLPHNAMADTIYSFQCRDSRKV